MPSPSDLIDEINVADREAAARLLGAADAALAAVEPARLTERSLAREADGIRVRDPSGDGNDRLVKASGTAVLAVGKSARGMARGAHSALGNFISRGLVTSDAPGPVPEWAEQATGDHPVPGPGSLAAGRAALDLVENVQEGEVLLALISGGGSALLEHPRPGAALQDIRALNGRLLKSRAPIADVNRLRGALSEMKGGRLAARCRGQVITLAVSDVESDPAVISSGPTVRPSLTERPPLADLLGEYRIGGPLADRILRLAAERPSAAEIGQARNWGEDVTKVLADGRTAGRAAVDYLVGAGVTADLFPDRWAGDAMQAAEKALEIPEGGARVFWGETTLDVTGRGRGGRNQQAALTAALRLASTPHRFLAFGTDGVDGPTDAAGALVDGETAPDPAAARDHLARFDAYPFLERAGALLKTGRTGCNVADLWIADKTG